MSSNNPHPMNKEDSKEGPKVIHGWTNPDASFDEYSIGIFVLYDSPLVPEDVPATIVIGSKAIPEGEVVTKAEHEARVKALVKEMLETGTHNEDGWLVVRRQEIIGVLDRNGYTL